jgi:type 1 glutamine amidotransferase
MASYREMGTHLRVLIVTGGHEFDENAFMSAFNDAPDFAVTQVAHDSTASGCFFDSEADAWNRIDPTKFDVVVLYDLVARISESQRRTFLSIFDHGIGLLALHQSITSFPHWDEYEKILGGRFVIGDTPSADGHGLSENRYIPGDGTGTTQWPYSDFRTDVDVPVQMYDKEHPVARGLEEFTVRDLVYNGLRLQPDNRPLIITPQIHAGHPYGWSRNYEASRIIYLQLCHASECQRNAGYQELIRRSVRWVGRVI